MEDFSIFFNDTYFYELKFSKNKNNYPWTSNKEADLYFDKLINDGSYISKLKYKNLIKQEINEDIHIKLSYYVVFRYICFLSLLLSLTSMLLLLNSNLSLSFLVISILSYMFLTLFYRKACNLVTGLKLCKDLIELVFKK